MDYVNRRANCNAQYDWASGASSYRFQPSLTHDVLFSVVQSVCDHRWLVAAKAAIESWIFAYALSKVVVVQSVIRCWLVRKRCIAIHIQAIYNSGDVLEQNAVEPSVVDCADVISVLTASEVVEICCEQNQLLLKRIQSWCHIQRRLQLK